MERKVKIVKVRFKQSGRVLPMLESEIDDLVDLGLVEVVSETATARYQLETR